ncbi:uncharacterized protein N7483_011350 [Penicillium malachiteum]|uniref:uncharacterized protein n=1 Tax=Penicillium malachiteum TaxID=1324776 RepID=UPI002548A312|nr:uncharacterized protein N7483_011350 [Penicillium malachiteum]KAJ5714169.1 hypothetical protein N7483_011350 [Penicillium malachiteum]
MSSLAPVPEDDQLELSDKYDISKGRLWPVNFPEVPRSDYGFPNDSDRCYRNVMVQMLLHLPAFTAWLEDYVMGRHLPKEEVEGSGAWCERINGQPCLLCLFTGLLWNRVWSQWDNGTGNFVGQQDTLEFWPEFLGQLRNDIDPTMYDLPL